MGINLVVQLLIIELLEFSLGGPAPPAAFPAAGPDTLGFVARAAAAGNLW
jgi:hypothetical protein